MKKRRLFLIFSLTILFAVSLTTMLATSVVWSAKKGQTSQIISGRFLTIEHGRYAPDAITSGELRRGLSLSPYNNQSQAVFKFDFSGVFELDYYLYADNVLKSAEFTFFDKATNQSFVVAASIEGSNRKYRIETDGAVLKTDSSGYKGTVSSEADRLKFDSNDLKLYLNGQQIWDFTRLVNNGQKTDILLHGFERYTVSIGFKVEAEGAKMIMYALNGQDLSGALITEDTAAPSIYAPIRFKGIKNKEFTLPEPVVVDICDGVIPSESVDVCVKYNNLELYSGAYTADLSFTPLTSGNYEITYCVADKAGNIQSLKQTYGVLDVLPITEFALSEIFEDCTVGVNSSIVLPSAKSSSLLSGESDVKTVLTVWYNGQAVEDCKEVSAVREFRYIFSGIGEYLIKYTALLGENSFNHTVKVVVDGTTPTFTQIENIDKFAVINAVYAIPKAEMSLNGTTLQARAHITYPSGAVYENNTVVLSEYGIYTIRYFAVFGGAEYSIVKQFTCLHNQESLFTLDENISIVKSDFDLSASSLKGVAISHKDTYGEAVYTQKLNLSGITKSDLLAELIAFPEALNTREFGGLEIILRDTVNPSNSVSVIVTRSNASSLSPASYVKATHSNQTPVGVAADGTVRINDYYGHMINHSFAANHGTRAPEATTIKIYFDYNGKKLYMGNNASNGSDMLVDLNDMSYFNKKFEGFTNNECYISFKVRELSAARARYLVTHIYGQDLTTDFFNDYPAPIITVDALDVIPKGIVNVNYPIFPAHAVDAFENVLPVTTKVYYDYDTSRAIDINIVDNIFVPKKEGNYTIVYSTEDGLKQRTERTVNIAVTAAEFDLQLNIDNQTVTPGKTGIPYYIEQVGYQFNRGPVSIKVSLADSKGNITELTENYFIVEAADTYTVKYEATDYLKRRAETSYEVEVHKAEAPVFSSQLKLLPVYTADTTYYLPELYATDYSGDRPLRVTPSVKVVYEDDGEEQEIGEDLRYRTPSISGVRDFKVVYTATGATGGVSTLDNDSVLVYYNMQSGQIVIEDYFVKDNITAKSSESDISLSVGDYENFDTARFIFVKPLLASNFSLRFTMDKKYNNFDSITFYLQDSLDIDVTIKLTIEKKDSTSYLYINNSSDAHVIEGSFWGDDAQQGSANDFQLYFSNSTLILRDATMNMIDVITYDCNGAPFEGFKSNRLFLTGVFNGAEGASGINIYNINSQSFYQLKVDNISPMLYVTGEYGGVAAKNSIAVIPAAVADDVLGTCGTVRVTVTTPSGNYAKSTNNIELREANASSSYSLLLNEPGKYIVTYRVSDSNGKETATTPKTIYVMEDTEITFTLESRLSEKYKVNKQIKIPLIKTDNSGFIVKYMIILIGPDFDNQTLYNSASSEKSGLSFTPAKKGEYRLRYYVYDSYYNYIIKDYYFTVQ